MLTHDDVTKTRYQSRRNPGKGIRPTLTRTRTRRWTRKSVSGSSRRRGNAEEARVSGFHHCQNERPDQRLHRVALGR